MWILKLLMSLARVIAWVINLLVKSIGMILLFIGFSFIEISSYLENQFELRPEHMWVFPQKPGLWARIMK